MSFEFRLPDIGEGLSQAEIVHWLVREGDHVDEDQPLVEIETDKAVVEMPAPASGTVVAFGGGPGDVIHVGDVLVVIDDGTGPGDGGPPAAAAGPVTTATDSVDRPADRASRPRPAATPATRSLARELGVDLAGVAGSGPGGRISDADVTAAHESRAGDPSEIAPQTAARPAPDEPAGRPRIPADGAERIPLRGVRRRTAETMTAAWRSVPHVNSFHEVDLTDLLELRAALKPMAERRDVTLTVTAFFVKATALALAEHPILNSSLDEEAGEIVIHPARHIAVAVDTPDGLVLPVVRDADRLSVIEIARHLDRSADLARRRRVTPAEMADSTFTISNHGVFGGWFGTSLVHGHEVGIVGFGLAQPRPVFDDEGAVVSRRILVMNTAADHRVVDGRDIIQFCVTLRRHLEAPLGLLLEDR